MALPTHCSHLREEAGLYIMIRVYRKRRKSIALLNMLLFILSTSSFKRPITSAVLPTTKISCGRFDGTFHSTSTHRSACITS
jgi:hypothetical protein